MTEAELLAAGLQGRSPPPQIPSAAEWVMSEAQKRAVMMGPVGKYLNAAGAVPRLLLGSALDTFVGDPVNGLIQAGYEMRSAPPASDEQQQAATNAALDMGTLGGVAGSAPAGAMAMGAVRRGADLPMDEASRMARAEEMGFYLDRPLYHGTAQDFSEFTTGARDPEGNNRLASLATWTSDDPAVAGQFADRASQQGIVQGAQVLPLYHRAERPQALAFEGGESRGAIAREIEKSWAEGHDSVQIKSPEIPDGGSYYAIRNPNQLRSRFARFDPERRDDADLLAANGGPVAGVTLTIDNRDPEEKRREAIQSRLLGDWLRRNTL